MTSQPLDAATCPMPVPIAPAPIIATLFIVIINFSVKYLQIFLENTI
jgi:hypothetical protein